MQNKARLDNYLILKTLGTGYTGKVKLGRDMDSGVLRALKILDPSKMDTQKLGKVIKSLENELNVMQNLNHKNIVRFLGLNNKGHYTTKRGAEKRVAYAVIELASKGEIFEVLFKIGPFNENMARFYMKQLVGALDYLHSNKVAHRDLKPENLLLDDEMSLKLADFGFATLFEEDQKNKTKLGTERYMSPELFNKKPYSAAKADVFAAGVILFIFYSGHPPFHEGRLEDPYYNVFMKNRQKFWDFHAKQNKKRIYSESYKALVAGMIEFDPEKRFSIDQVRDSEWLNESVDEAKALEDMTLYMQAMLKTLEQSDKMQVEDTHEYRTLAQNDKRDVNPLYNSKSNLLVADYEKIATECLSQAKSIPNVVPIKCKNKPTLIDAIVRTVQQIPETKVVWNDAKDKFKIKHTTEYGETILSKVKIYHTEGQDFGLSLVKDQGPSIDFYKFKAKLVEMLVDNL